jgi:hypothetical protein
VSRLQHHDPEPRPFQHDLIHAMILDKKLKTHEMANVAGYSEPSIKAIRSNLHYFGTTKAPPNGGGRPRSITPPMLEVLCEHLLEKPELYLEEMAVLQNPPMNFRQAGIPRTTRFGKNYSLRLQNNCRSCDVA